MRRRTALTAGVLVILLAVVAVVALVVRPGGLSGSPPVTTALFIGDSYASGGYRGVTPAQAFPCRAAAALHWRCELDALGATGYAADGTPFVPGGHKAYGQRLPHTRNVHPDPDVIVVTGGRNDTAQLIGPASRQYLADLATAYPGVRIIVVEPFWMGPVPADVAQARLAVKASAESVGATWIPTQDWLTAADLSWDLIHPTLAGQAAITGHLTAALRAAVPS